MPATQRLPPQAARSSLPPERILRAVVGSIAALALLWVAFATGGSYLSASKANASAIQITQLVVEGCFAALVVFGLAVSTYISSR